MKIDISSTALEKGIDIAKDFLNKLVTPAIEESGLLIKDQVALWRFKNQIKILNKAKTVCEKNNISPKTISLKLLCPFLEYSSLEEDSEMQDKWAILLANLVDSEQNIENHVFPYILSQISTKEFLLLEAVSCDQLSRHNMSREELNQIEPKLVESTENLLNAKKILQEYISLNAQYIVNEIEYRKEVTVLQGRVNETNVENRTLRFRRSLLLDNLRKSEEISDENFEGFEISNLIRLGLIKEVHEAHGDSQTIEIPNNPEEPYLSVDVDFDVNYSTKTVITELGMKFIQSCTEKKKTVYNDSVASN